jgi:hypothetical protein
VTIAFGSRDMVMLPGIARRRDHLPDHTRWVTLPGCGHLQMFDDPAAVVELLRASTDPRSLRRTRCTGPLTHREPSRTVGPATTGELIEMGLPAQQTGYHGSSPHPVAIMEVEKLVALNDDDMTTTGGDDPEGPADSGAGSGTPGVADGGADGGADSGAEGPADSGAGSGTPGVSDGGADGGADSGAS